MKNIIFSLLLWVGGITTLEASTFDTFCERNNARTSVETIKLLAYDSRCVHADLFKEELGRNQRVRFDELHSAALDCERGRACRLVTKPCGDCSLWTAGVRNGRVNYWRRVEPNEPVAYYDGVPIMLPQCANAVLNIEPRIVEIPAPQPVAPPPQARQEPPRRVEGCTPDQVSYTTEVYDLPATIVGQWGLLGHSWVFDAGAFSWTTSHHHWVCVENISEKE